MATELFLILLTISTAFIDRRERMAALLFLSMAHIYYFIATSLESTLVVLNLSMIAEMVSVVMLYCIKGSTRSKLIHSLIPISILAIPMHFYGIYLFKNEYPMIQYNNLVDVYYFVILLLFVSMSRWSMSFYRWVANKRYSDSGSINQPVDILCEHGNKPRSL